MTREEKEFCNRCPNHSDCGYVNRGMEEDCTVLDVFSHGYQAALDKACKWLGQQQEMLDDVFSDINDFVDLFEKAMEE